MIILDKALEERERIGKPVQIAVIGAGYMARGILAHILDGPPGIRLAAVCSRRPDAAAKLLGSLAVEPVAADSAESLEQAVAAGKTALTQDPTVVCAADSIDVVIETTGEIEYGAKICLNAIERGKHLVLVNAELDCTVGPILASYARRAGTVLTNTDGDEPGVVLNLLRYVRGIGLHPLLAGNIKGFLDHSRTPETQRAFAETVGQRAHMVTSFADGTKLAMEATLVANATGFTVLRRGMTGFRVDHVGDVLGQVEDSQLVKMGGAVDFVLGAAPGTGAFVVGRTENPLKQEYLRYFKMGDGPLYVFYQPWHLPQADAPLTAARAALFLDAAVSPRGAPVCEVVAIAKRDLEAGEEVDSIGGFTVYGVIERADVAADENLLPIGVAVGCVLRRDVAANAALTYDDVELPEGRIVDRLRGEQRSQLVP